MQSDGLYRVKFWSPIIRKSKIYWLRRVYSNRPELTQRKPKLMLKKRCGICGGWLNGWVLEHSCGSNCSRLTSVISVWLVYGCTCWCYQVRWVSQMHGSPLHVRAQYNYVLCSSLIRYLQVGRLRPHLLLQVPLELVPRVFIEAAAVARDTCSFERETSHSWKAQGAVWKQVYLRYSIYLP